MKEHNGLIRENYPLGLLTSYGCGGSVSYFCSANSIEDLRFAVSFAQSAGLPLLMLGGGTNILVSDSGVKALVVKLGGELSAISVDGDTVRAGAGATMGSLAVACIDAGLSGLEGCVGIPGTVGGALWGNAGTPLGSISDCVESVEILSPETGVVTAKTKGECGFGYRRSALHRLVILGGVFKMRRSTRAAVKDLAIQIVGMRGKHPHGRSAGCVFKNPEAGPAGKLIDGAGMKLARVGGAFVSDKHANFIISDGATSSDIHALLRRCREAVKAKYSVDLEPEIRLWGFDNR
ncbi:MAG: UDP-N-acetylmuramate dehydrogenase [Candidatus Brocadiia bacterium]